MTSAIASLILTFIGQPREAAALRLFILIAGLAVLAWFATSKTVDRMLGKVIEWMLDRFTDIRVVDYETLLGVGHGYMVSSIRVSKNSWLAGKTLREMRLKDEGIIVMAIYRRLPDGRTLYIGAPGPETRILPGDEIIVYGHEDAIRSLSKRIAGPEGDREHKRMIEAHKARRMT